MKICKQILKDYILVVIQMEDYYRFVKLFTKEL